MKEEKKLSYEELEAYASQAVTNAKQIYEENKKLKNTVDYLKEQLRYNQLELAFKVLEHKDVFSKDLIDKIVARLELILSPTDNQEEVEQNDDNKDGE